MEGDLSLSQSFGGLRIANPDDDDSVRSDREDQPNPYSSAVGIPSVISPASTEFASPDASSPPARTLRTPSDSQSQSRRHSIFNLLRRGDSSSESSNPTSPPSSDLKPSITRSQTNNSETSQPIDPAAKAAAAKAYRQSMPMNHQAQQQALFTHGSNVMQSSRSQYNPSVTGAPGPGVYAAQPPAKALPNMEPGTYRSRGDPALSSTNLPVRSNSRGGAAVLQAVQAGVPSREGSHRDRSYNNGHQIPLGNGPAPPRVSSRGMGGSHTDTTGQILPNGTRGALESPSSQGAPGSGNGGPLYDLEGKPILSREEWKDKGAATGMRQEYDANGNIVMKQVKKGVRDFIFGRTLGEGSYSTVVFATDRQTLKEYAVKILDKKHIIKEKKIKYVNIEKDTLNRLIEHPGIIRLFYTFQDSQSLYYVLDMASGGELLGVLKKIGSFDEECTRYYGAQILEAIEHMHNRGVIHRDLKPENILLDDQMHIKITDFGTAKLLPDPRVPNAEPNVYGIPGTEDDESTRARSFVGTAEYVSPELLTDKSACKASDLWAFGCMIYQLLTGRPPFKAGNEYQTFQKIVQLDYSFPPGFPPAARDLVERLLVLDPQRRLSIEHIKNHEFFDGIKWGRGLWKTKAPRLKPYVPPAQEPNVIKLNGGYSNSSQPSPTSRSQAVPPQTANGNARPAPRIITELPPPTQLDIEWSPVLTRNNERILKLGNVMVLSSPLPHSPKHGEDGHEKKKLSRFFGGSTTKKRQRLVMVTSSARIIMAAAGGDEKKAKGEISLLGSECTWRTQIDAKGQTVWCVDTRGMHYTFEDIKTSTTTADPNKTSAQEWIESLERAKDLAYSQSMSGSYNSETGFDIPSSVSSPSSTIHGSSIYQEGYAVSDRSGRNHLTKSQASLGGEDAEAKNKRNRFSKRQSKNGLSTPF
ncbi:putative 3-phosphoinositide-dependent protein kinase 1 [Coleophoma crateriformis]|uniref:non-specific serine/threonine protein kinase n=1 Tax=Coleophoma crateriformis TaxID=565419 RepID=A0A3D8RDF3_9HELO|nr:putative 3-phosphoinositide-dependent protein kinase 1 [Coleophoma crateriformis]